MTTSSLYHGNIEDFIMQLQKIFRARQTAAFNILTDNRTMDLETYTRSNIEFNVYRDAIEAITEAHKIIHSDDEEEDNRV